MNPPPEDHHKVLLDLIYRLVIEARCEAWTGEAKSMGKNKKRFSRIAKLMDTIHNLPHFLADYEGWDQNYFEMCLGDKDPDNKGSVYNTYKALCRQYGVEEE